ncbi:MAG: FAD-dependent monooxygenase [Sphingopyxis sp.]|nr:FAD-dependent monooxygenase [Sphingopyxis sp.]
MTTEGDCEILVVGAGPTGLMAANLLARSGVRVRIVERRAEATRESRAFAVQARSLELLQAMGLAERFVERGVIARSVNIHVKGKFAGGLDFTRAETGDTPFPVILMIPQSESEALLAADLEALGVTIERGVDCTGFTMDAEGVNAALAHDDGRTENLRCAYIVGGDGSRSVVRAGAGIGWDGELLPQRFLLADCRVDWPLDHDNFRVFLNGPLIGLFLPLKGSACSRVMATDMSGSFGDEDGSTPAPLDLAEMEAGLAAAIDLPVKLSDPVWVTRYRAHHRFVDRYGKGRAFVAGDAAHIHSPAGGQGMNTGLQDAANLAWKLAAVLRGADAALLDSYGGERLPVGEAVVKRTGRLFAAAAGQAGFKARMRDRLLPIILPFISKKKPFQTNAFKGASQRGIAYPADGRLVPADSAGGKGPKPGERAPDAPWPGDGTLYEALAGYRFTLLALSLDPADDDSGPALAGLQDALTTFDPRAEPVVIDAIPADAPLATRYGLGAGRRRMLYIIRPDGYVGWRGAGWDVAAAARWIASLGTAGG